MNTLPSKCPFCGGEITVTRFQCQECDVTIEGRFDGGPFSQLSPEQLQFVETFIRCEGKITKMEVEIGLSYPTIRNRLHEIIRVLGYEPGVMEASDSLTSEERQQILDNLDKGLIDPEEALHLLKEHENH